MRSYSRIAMVGGGAAAVCLLDALSEAGISDAHITVFDSGPNLWRGRAYQRDLALARTNLTPSAMSVRSAHPADFTRWLADRATATEFLDEACGIQFVPRTLFGDYLEHTASVASAALRERGCQVEVVRENVESATPCLDSMKITTDRGTVTRVKHTVLCVGGTDPSDVYGLTGAPGFVPDPYPLREMRSRIDPDASVGILGSGLTAIDAVLALAAHGHLGPIRLLSRTGVLPAVRQRPITHTPQFLTADRFSGQNRHNVTVRELVDVVRAELAAAGEATDALEAEIAAVYEEEPVARLRRQLADTDSPSRALRILQRTLPNLGPDVWTALPDIEKAMLSQRYLRAAMSLCCPLPPSTGARILSLIDARRLALTSGLRTVETGPTGGFVARTDTGPYRFDVVVNAVTVRADAVPSKSAALVRCLVSSGLATPHPRGGVHVARATSRTTASESTATPVYAMGELAAGSLFFTFGLPSIVDRAVDVATAIRSELDAAANALNPVTLAGGNRP